MKVIEELLYSQITSLILESNNIFLLRKITLREEDNTRLARRVKKYYIPYLSLTKKNISLLFTF